MKWQDWITSTYNKDNIDFEEIPSEYIKALRLEEMNTMYLGSKEKIK